MSIIHASDTYIYYIVYYIHYMQLIICWSHEKQSITCLTEKSDLAFCAFSLFITLDSRFCALFGLAIKANPSTAWVGLLFTKTKITTFRLDCVHDVSLRICKWLPMCICTCSSVTVNRARGIWMCTTASCLKWNETKRSGLLIAHPWW